jgi:hypothetical protein
VPAVNFLPQFPRAEALGAGLTLVGYDLPVDEARGGDTVSVVTYWDAAAAAQVTLTLEDDSGGITRSAALPVPRGDNISLQTDLRLPPGAEGEQTLVVTFGTQAVTLAEIVAEPVTVPDPGEIGMTTDDVFGGMVALVGYDLPATVVVAGQDLRLDLFWSSLAPVDQDYKIFVHLVGAEFNPDTGNPLWGQVDRQPLEGSLPMTVWPPGEIIRDSYTLPVDPDAPPGAYHLEVGLYDGVTGQRLAVTAPAGASSDSILLETIFVEPAN